MKTIFIQIASYRDPELAKTLQSCLNASACPERLRFGICWQHEEGDTEINLYSTDKRFKILPIHWSKSRGVGWARYLACQLYNGEDFVLQIDSHSRFADNWDVEIIEEWERCNHPKAVLSGYPPGFDYDEYEEGKEIWHPYPQMSMAVKGFDGGFIPTFKTLPIPNGPINRPFRGSFVAGGFYFSVGSLYKEVPYSMDVYFTGEEILYSVRLFTYGYRVFYPQKSWIWHLYGRKNYKRHWDDFTKDPALKKSYDDMIAISNKTLGRLLKRNAKHNRFLGEVNTVADFENYSGVSFKHRVIHPDHSLGKEPPIEESSGWEDRVRPIKEIAIDMNLNITDIPERDDYTFWFFGFHDQADTEMFREDIVDEKSETFKKHPVRFNKKVLLREVPYSYTIWPYCKEKGWLERLVFLFEDRFLAKC